MKSPALRSVAALFALGLVTLLCGAKSVPADPVVPMGNNTFSITRSASNGFMRDTDKLKEEVRAEAERYCAAQGKLLRLDSLTAKKPLFAMGYASATITFRAVDSLEPEVATTAAGIRAESAPTPTGNLYNDLLKLDELRKRGILTEEEFQSEKKKALSRSQ